MTALVLAVQAGVIALAVGLGIAVDDLGMAFDETGFVTFFSCAQLAGIAWLCRLIARERRRVLADPAALAGVRVWTLMSLGFAFLALDEIAQIHEKLDYLAHTLFIGEETALTDRLDDLIVGLYGLVGVAVLAAYRRELVRHRAMLPYLGAGFAVLVVMVALDTLTNREDVMLALVEPAARARALLAWLSVGEDSLKIVGEGIFLAGFLSVRAHAAHRAPAQRELRPVIGRV